MIYFKKTSTMLILKIYSLFCKKKPKNDGDMQKKLKKRKICDLNFLDYFLYNALHGGKIYEKF
mgnify:CR=1 FL=1